MYVTSHDIGYAMCVCVCVCETEIEVRTGVMQFFSYAYAKKNIFLHLSVVIKNPLSLLKLLKIFSVIKIKLKFLFLYR